jgi:hypothetical protein
MKQDIVGIKINSYVGAHNGHRQNHTVIGKHEKQQNGQWVQHRESCPIEVEGQGRIGIGKEPTMPEVNDVVFGSPQKTQGVDGKKELHRLGVIPPLQREGIHNVRDPWSGRFTRNMNVDTMGVTWESFGDKRPHFGKKFFNKEVPNEQFPSDQQEG